MKETKIKVNLKMKKDTVHTRRYDGEGNIGKLRAIYVPKWILLQTFGELPENITVTVEKG